MDTTRAIWQFLSARLGEKLAATVCAATAIGSLLVVRRLVMAGSRQGKVSSTWKQKYDFVIGESIFKCRFITVCIGNPSYQPPCYG